jgi:hypothetical protein
VPFAELIYCHSLDDVVHFAGPLGRYLARSGMPLMLIGSNGPIPKLIGRYYEHKMPFYYKGADRPRSGDLAYTEAAMFGL